MRAVADMQGFLRWPTERSRLWLDSFVDGVSRHPAVVAVVAIGSGVRANVPSNDLDLVVVTRGDPVPLSDVPIEVDIRQYAEGEVEEKILAGHDLPDGQ